MLCHKDRRTSVTQSSILSSSLNLSLAPPSKRQQKWLDVQWPREEDLQQQLIHVKKLEVRFWGYLLYQVSCLPTKSSPLDQYASQWYISYAYIYIYTHEMMYMYTYRVMQCVNMYIYIYIQNSTIYVCVLYVSLQYV